MFATFCSAIKALLLLSLNSACVLLFLIPCPAFSETIDNTTGESSEPPKDDEFKRVEFLFEPDAYYTNAELIIALTDAPIPHMGEKTEAEIYRTMLSRAAVLPQYVVLEASINPMPYLGVYLKREHSGFYENARVSGSFNWVQALTAGFEEPYAVSLLAGNVVAFDMAESNEIQGTGYSGYLFSAGTHHIRNNSLIRDRWRELEWKIKGDRKSPVKKLSWSFRIGAKLHDHHDITDIVYLSFRRSRLDYKTEGSPLLNNSGFEYTVDLNRKGVAPIRHYFYVDKKWPFGNRQMAFTFAVGFVWESAEKYTGALAAGNGGRNVQFLLRPNIEF